MKEVMALINSWVDGLPREFPSFDARQGVWVRSPKTANHGPVYDIKDKWSKLNQYMNVTELDWEEVFQASIQNYEHYVQMLEDILNFNPRADLPPNAEMLSVPYDIYIEFLNPAHQLFNSPAQVADPAMTALISPTHYDPMAVKSHMQEGLGHPFKAAFPASDPKLVEEVLR
jgi:hypothetical protein